MHHYLRTLGIEPISEIELRTIIKTFNYNVQYITNFSRLEF